MKFLTASLVALALLFAATASQAAPPLPSGNPNPDKIEGYCGENGGTYWPPTEAGVYGCVLSDGTIIVCGGSLPGCDTIPPNPLEPSSKLPLAVIGTVFNVQTKTELDEVNDKLDLLGVMVDDLGTLVENECSPPPVLQ